MLFEDPREVVAIARVKRLDQPVNPWGHDEQVARWFRWITNDSLTITDTSYSTRTLTVAGQCHALRLPPGLTVELSFGPRVRQGVYGYPQLTITQETKGASTSRVDLAKTKDYTAQLTGPTTQNSWLAGWNALSGTKLTRIGSGTLTMSSNGKSGTLQATMLRYTGAIKGPIEVTATWGC